MSHEQLFGGATEMGDRSAFLIETLSGMQGAERIVEALRRDARADFFLKKGAFGEIPQPYRDAMIGTLACGPSSQPLPNRLLLGKVGSGGSGTAELAWDLKRNRPRLVKEYEHMQPEKAVGIAMREAVLINVIAEVKNPALGPDSARNMTLPSGRVWTEQEFCEGLPLSALLDLSNRRFAIATLFHIANAIQALHDKCDIVHGDIKPQNIFWDMRRQMWRLWDCGLSKINGETRPFDEGASGTPLYIAPEMFGDEHRGIAADNFSLGVMAYQMLTGQFPCNRRDSCVGLPSFYFMQMTDKDYKRLRQSDMPRSFIRVLRTLLVRDPSCRSTAGQFALACKKVWRSLFPKDGALDEPSLGARMMQRFANLRPRHWGRGALQKNDVFHFPADQGKEDPLDPYRVSGDWEKGIDRVLMSASAIQSAWPHLTIPPRALRRVFTEEDGPPTNRDIIAINIPAPASVSAASQCPGPPSPPPDLPSTRQDVQHH